MAEAEGRESCKIPGYAHKARNCTAKSCAATGVCQEVEAKSPAVERWVTVPPPVMEKVRTFISGATRDTDTDKLDYEGFLSHAVLERYAQYMHKNRVQRDGSLRTSDNWQKGIPQDAYMKSAFRHFIEWWTAHREGRVDEEALCALLFNTMGYLFEHLKASTPTAR